MVKNAEVKESKKYGKYEEWEINNAVHTLIEAERIKLDKDKMKYVQPELEKEVKALKNVSNAADILYGNKKEGNNDN